jgi:hypothetical protein
MIFAYLLDALADEMLPTGDWIFQRMKNKMGGVAPPRPKPIHGHQTLRVTPAMAAGVANHVWSLEETVNLLR